jgi:TPR repeat protein
MPNCRHHGCRRKLPGFNGPTRCDECSPVLPHLIPGRGSITSHTPGNNDDTDDNRNNGDDDGNSDSKRKTRSSNRRLYEKGLAQVLGMNFQKKDIPGGQLMIVKSAAAGFPMAVAHCHLYGLKQGKKRKRETDINYKKRRVKAGKRETDMNYNKRRLKTAFKMLVTIEKQTHYHWSQYSLGVCYDNGYGTKKNYTKAVEWYSKSSEQKNPFAMINLGACYQHGEGVDEDKTKGFELYEQSALLGCSGAMTNVGGCYEDGRWQDGEGVTKDLNKAKEWYTKGAAQGNADSQNKLDALNAA